MPVDSEWIQDNLSQLMEHADELSEAADEVDNPSFGAWTGLKLMTFTAAVNVYTKVANGRFDYYYIDALSGSGIVDIEGRDATLAGSPIIAGTAPRHPFEKLYFIEENPERAQALRARLGYAADHIDSFQPDRDDCVVIQGDANEKLPEIQDRIENHREYPVDENEEMDYGHHFAFIDNERLEVKYATIRELLDRFLGDHLINYQEVGISRTDGRLKSDNLSDDDWEELYQFFGTERVRGMNADERIELYREKMADVGQTTQREVFIEGANSYPYGYRLLYTAGGDPDFIEFMDNYGEKIESLNGDDVDRVIRTMTGQLGTLEMLEDQRSFAGFDD